MKVALVYDRVTKWGGAERVLLAMHELWPDAPLYTAVYDKKRASWAKVFSVHPSFLQYIPLAKYAHELFAWVTPMAFETFSFDAYDLVISVTSAEAKNILTKPGTVHVCYCLTPTRYLWSGYSQYLQNPGLGVFSGLAKLVLKTIAPTLRSWDLVSASRPDYFIAISKRVADRISTYYKKNVDCVIYPPVNTKQFVLKQGKDTEGQEYFLVVSRLVAYKRIDVLIHACTKLNMRLVVLGSGHEEKSLRQMAGPTIEFVNYHLTDSELVRYHQGCRAFIYAADEDFGIAAVEAMASGKPVIAFRESGVAESIIDGKTGILYDSQDPKALIRAIKQFEKKKFDPQDCRQAAEKFDTAVFKKQLKGVIENLYSKQLI